MLSTENGFSRKKKYIVMNRSIRYTVVKWINLYQTEAGSDYELCFVDGYGIRERIL